VGSALGNSPELTLHKLSSCFFYNCAGRKHIDFQPIGTARFKVVGGGGVSHRLFL